MAKSVSPSLRRDCVLGLIVATGTAMPFLAGGWAWERRVTQELDAANEARIHALKVAENCKAEAAEYKVIAAENEARANETAHKCVEAMAKLAADAADAAVKSRNPR